MTDPGGSSPIPRTGLGFDVHRFSAGRPLVLGGVPFDHELGLAGHSDGDVVCHALADALLGAVALGDVGDHFPETDPAFEGIAGPALLARTVGVLAEAGARPWSCDVSVICDRPSIAPERAAMRSALAEVLGVALENVSVKATRPEGLGLQPDGIGCLAIAVVV
ncbi:MAG: 2-C-methyl-D-erythritol 2,4-cyclodiphosphate synthase [Actinomycetota bacterium]